MKTANLFQKEQDNVDYNACVGNNGWININTYIHGYQAATLVMLESVLKSVNCRKDVPENANYWYVDTAIYPILFSARHYIELYLKQKVYAINQFKINKKIEDKLVRTHDINKLWGLLKTIVNETHDSRISEFIIAIEPYVNDFSKIDLTGETFRYPYNQDYTKKHLENMSVIGLYNFYHKFNKLSKYMTDFDCLIDYLYDEYKTHTYTSHLNREDIENIAKKLPVHTDWKKDEFRKKSSLLFDTVYDLKEMFIDNELKLWQTIVVSVNEDMKLTINFDYTKWFGSAYTPMKRHEYYCYKYLGKVPEDKKQEELFKEMEEYQSKFNK